MTYYIKGWRTHFEVAQTRAVKAMQWVAVPNRHDGKSYRRLMRHPDAGSIYAAWILLVQVASRCPVRGALEDEDGPLTADDLEMKTGLPASVYEMAIPVLLSKEIGWLSLTPDRQNAPTIQQTEAPLQCVEAPLQHVAATGQDITGQDTTTTYRTEPENVVVAELESHGFGMVPKLVADAKTRGWSIPQIQAVADHWQNHRASQGWQHGILVEALRGQPCEPAGCLAVRATVIRTDPLAEETARQREREQRRPELMRRFAADLDAMTSQQRLELLSDQQPSIQNLARVAEPKWKSSKQTADLMLAAMQRNTS